MKKRLTLGIDFDGTIVTEEFPNIGEIIPETVEFVKRAYELGHLIIIWTARTGEYQQDVENFLKDQNIPFHYINENPEDPFAIRGEQGRKIFCDYYYDDRAVRVGDLDIIRKAIGEDIQVFPCKARLKSSFSMIQWHGEDYGIDSYEEDAEEDRFEKNEEVEVLKHVGNQGMGELYVIYSDRLKESTVVYDGMLEFL